jgi:NAD(P)-dependent dehydrogenase (short-subunit alcohol dehydrogenase family)
LIARTDIRSCSPRMLARVRWCQGRVAIVTGAADGLGAAFAVALRGAGVTVEACDIRSREDVSRVDVAEPQQVKAFVDAVFERHGRVDILVANAGICRATNVLGSWEEAVDDYDAHFRVNTLGVYLFGRAVAPLMTVAGDGHIVVISTDHVVPPPDRPTGGGARMDVYDASKWALRGFVEGWARALAPHGVRVNALGMGATDTAMLRGFLGNRFREEMVANWMRPEEIGRLLVDLLDEGSEGRSGQTIGIWVDHPIELPTVASDG